MSDIPADIAELKSRARSAYYQMEDVWPVGDPWSEHTERNINAFVQRFVPAGARRVLNAGCGGNDYGLPPGTIAANMDISMRQCRPLPRPVVGDVEHIPFADNFFDVTICVGAVINYVRPEVAIPELVRVTKPGGLTLVDFESSFSAEIMFSKPWAKRTSVIERLYVDHMDKQHLYSLGHVRSLFEGSNSRLIESHSYHTATALWERIFRKALIPRAAFTIDPLTSRIPGFRALGSSILVACQKA
jgi:SAM-dependent methyltransferase